MRAIVLVISLLLLPLTSFASAGVPEGCSAAPVDEAARELVHPAAEVVEVDELGAVALEPLVYPGVRARLLEHGGVWCTLSAFNAAVDGTPLDRASRFAQVAAAPWFDGAEVVDARETAPGVFAIATHARTNGIDAAWTVVVDAAGVREATWTATAFGVAPLEADLEGFTAFPGASRSYHRDAAGAIRVDEPLADLRVAPPATPQVTVIDRMPDGFRIQFHYGEAGFYPSLQQEPLPLDVIRHVVRENYEEFLAWGLQKGWSANIGHVWVDSATAAQCIACVFIAQDFNIHISSQVVPALRALAGVSYPDDRAALSTVIGHEMFHNFQNAYSKPTVSATFMGGAYSEGLARFQETIHTYSAVSHQSFSLVYAANGNGCNDELGPQSSGPTLFDGPSTGQSYSACSFWLAFYGHHGIDGVRALLEASNAHHEKTGWDEIQSIIEDATGAPVDDDLARYAADILTWEGMTWGPVVGGSARDWTQYLEGWDVPTLSPGGEYTRTIRDGGMMAAEVAVDGVVMTNGAAGTALYVVHPDGSFARIASGDSIDAPAWIVSVHPGTGAATPTLSYE